MRCRRLEQRTSYPMSDGSVMHSEWEPFTGEGHDVPDTFLWKTEDYTAFVRTWNAAAKKRGDQGPLVTSGTDSALTTWHERQA